MQSLPALLLALSVVATRPAIAQSGAPTTQLPTGTRIPLAVIRPVWSKSVKPGDPIYTQTTFPATVDDHVAIPSGTYVEGQIDSLTKPTRKQNHATFAIHFTKIIFANGYTALLSDSAARATLDIQASPANDLLLDNGAQIEMTLGSALTLDSAQVAAAIPASKPLQPGSFKSATLCRPTPGYPGSPGSPDTVIPGSPGTPSTTIPGANGSPDITIPGTPATPATVIPGSPGTPDTPGTFCPSPPLVLSSSAASPTTAKHD
ncbi:hypothetical protein HDF16_003423 [Granulicella aggregans]|uniref:Uncharacterized protein n=1 Tax=Granulicella aggregans TaxID=474949 RepID=A0A7W7ZFM1_9BACT|nr:hypothetical protein [Granulicella aggregans]MBB5058709.1 hypothetical protein [Granulicella aggregans]